MERLAPKSTALVVVDIQEKLAAAMPPAAMERLIANTTMLLEAARILGVKVLASEQYPKGLGPTVSAVAEKLRAAHATPIDKLTFDACGAPGFALGLNDAAPRAVVVVGMETHVCVFQTARELVRRGFAPRREPGPRSLALRARRRGRDARGDRGVRLARARGIRRVQGRLAPREVTPRRET
jgi:nicotinamidase-related amidase